MVGVNIFEIFLIILCWDLRHFPLNDPNRNIRRSVRSKVNITSWAGPLADDE